MARVPSEAATPGRREAKSRCPKVVHDGIVPNRLGWVKWTFLKMPGAVILADGQRSFAAW